MTWNVTITVLISIFGSGVLVSTLYFIHAYLIPHLRRPKGMLDMTLPRPHRRSNHPLQASLYSLPSLNYIDPRNSIADTDLRSSRWSTNREDLSPSTSPMSFSLPRSPAMHFRTPSRQNTKSVVRDRNIPASTVLERAPESTPTKPASLLQTRARGRRERVRPPVLTLGNGKSPMGTKLSRGRSKSDSLASTQGGLLAYSHAVLYGHIHVSDLTSPTISNFSGTTLLSCPVTPQQRSRSRSTTRPERAQSFAEHRHLKSLGGGSSIRAGRSRSMGR